jgi:hypothetical protein
VRYHGTSLSMYLWVCQLHRQVKAFVDQSSKKPIQLITVLEIEDRQPACPLAPGS